MSDRTIDAGPVHCSSCGRDFDDTAAYRRRIYALETALRWLATNELVDLWLHNNELEMWSASRNDWVLAPNDIARTLAEFAEDGAP